MQRLLTSIFLLFLSLSFTGDKGELKHKTYSGVASYYASLFEGRLTANGEIFSNSEMTCAHKSLPFGTILRVTRPDIGKTIVVRVNDRGPYIKGREIDLSQKAAAALDMFSIGVCLVNIEIMPTGYDPCETKLEDIEKEDSLCIDQLTFQPIKKLKVSKVKKLKPDEFK